MSNHRSHRDINLHHQQVNSARLKRHNREIERRAEFEARRSGIRGNVEAERLCRLGLTAIWVLGSIGIVVAYVWWSVSGL